MRVSACMCSKAFVCVGMCLYVVGMCICLRVFAFVYACVDSLAIVCIAVIRFMRVHVYVQCCVRLCFFVCVIVAVSCMRPYMIVLVLKCLYVFERGCICS